MLRKFQIFSVMMIITASASAADSVDETAKCAATFSVLTNIGVLDAGLGKQFSFYSALAYTMTVFYSDADRDLGLTIAEASFLISEYQISIDHAEGNGEAFIPYVASCMGWAADLESAMASANANGRNFEVIAGASARPNMEKHYPFNDWPMMQDIFYDAYAEWVDMGKIAANDAERSLGLQ
jgi:hypothetical protein